MNLFISFKYLVALDDHRHFGRAALACHVTQPALSNALRSLEDVMGASIVKRGRNFEGFTAEGERVLVSARRILHEQELLQQDLKSREGNPIGNLMIGAVPSATPVAARFAANLQRRHPGIVVTLRSLSSIELETGLESLALDMGLGYTERMDHGHALLRVVPQYLEQYFLVRKAATPHEHGLQFGDPITWNDASRQPLCLLSPEMHNRTIVNRAFAAAGVQPSPAIETNSILMLALSVSAGGVCSVMPGALIAAVRGSRDLEALPLIDPRIEVPIAFMVQHTQRLSYTLQAALALARHPEWLHEAALHSGHPQP